jgi:SAM-dependent methyltransferase
VAQATLAGEAAGGVGRIWSRLRGRSLNRRRSRRSLARFCREVATDEYTLVVHSVDVDHKAYFPNSFVVGKRKDQPANIYTDAYFQDLQLIGTESFGMILCTALLEHVPDPERLVSEFHRILKPGGRLVISASAVFPFHGGADNFFHFTTNGFRYLFRKWSRLEVLRGSSRPFATIAILLQRINLQCEVFPLLRPLIALLYHVVPLLDVFVLRQYESAGNHTEHTISDAFMPAALYAVVVK